MEGESVFKEITKSIVEYSGKYHKVYFPKTDPFSVEAVARLAKLTEEVGELAEVVLNYLGKQRNKGKALGKEQLEEEIADVIISVSLLSYWFGIDPWLATEKKIRKVEERNRRDHG